MSRRVVVTGIGVVAPNAIGAADFELALRKGRSGLRRDERMAAAGFGCRVSGVPQGVDALCEEAFDADTLFAMNSGHRYAALAALEAWRHAGLDVPAPDDERVDWESGAVLGTGVGGMDTMAERIVPAVLARKVRRLGSTAIEQVMASGVSARVAGILGLGNQVTSNASACASGVEALAIGLERLRGGRARRMLCGGAEGANHHVWAGLDAMRVLSRAHEDEPEKASRPMSASAAGLVPACGAGVLVLETLESALEREAPILAELAGAGLGCGGQRGGGSMTAANPEGLRRCIREALADADEPGAAVGAINGHLTGTGADPAEVRAWADALGVAPAALPPITSTKSLVGHALGAAGGLECVATVLMLRRGFVHASKNCDDLHPEIEPFAASVPHETRPLPGLRLALKAGFGFGDVNACVAFRRFDGHDPGTDVQEER